MNNWQQEAIADIQDVLNSLPIANTLASSKEADLCNATQHTLIAAQIALGMAAPEDWRP